MSDTTEVWICVRTIKCAWAGPYERLKQIPHPKIKNAEQGVCPKCGGKTFYVRRPKKEGSK